MSGGSLGYLYRKDFEPDADVFAYVAKELRELGHEAAAQESDAIAACIAEAVARRDRLADVLRAVEWCESGDLGPEEVADHVAAWEAQRAAAPSPPPTDKDQAADALADAVDSLLRNAGAVLLPGMGESRMALLEYRKRRNPCP